MAYNIKGTRKAKVHAFCAKYLKLGVSSSLANAEKAKRQYYMRKMPKSNK